MRNLGALCAIAVIGLTISASGAPRGGNESFQLTQALGTPDAVALKPDSAPGSWIAFARAGHQPTVMGDLVNPW